MGQNKKVTIILPVYCVDDEVRGHLAHCLDNLLKHTDQSLFELIVIENGSSAVPEAIPPILDFRYQYVWMEKPIGYARAVNFGMKVADTEYVCVLSSDVFVTPNWLETLIADYESIPDCGVLAPNGPLGITFNSHWWACVLIRKSVVDMVGLLDESLPFMYHDQCWNIECHKAGYKIARTGNVQVEHVGRVTYGRVPDQWSTAERAEMIRRHGAPEFQDWIKKR